MGGVADDDVVEMVWDVNDVIYLTADHDAKVVGAADDDVVIMEGDGDDDEVSPVRQQASHS